MNIKLYIKRLFNYLLHGIPTTIVNAEILQTPSSDLLKGRTALITGGTGGIGYAIADAFLSSGSNVIISGRNRERLEECVAKLQIKHPNIDKIQYVIMDNRDVSSIEKAMELTNMQNIDILVNNAGVAGGNISNATVQDYDAILETNLRGPFFLSKIVAQNMINNKIKGNILNIASSSSLRPANSAYNISKWGIRGLTLGMAKSLIKHNIIVNGIAPGPTFTTMLKKDISKSNDISNYRLPSGRFAMPEEIASMAVVMVSSLGRTIVGDIIYMTGGAGIITFDDVDYSF